VVFGHAKDGNLHFLINQAFNTEDDTQHFDRFVRATVEIVSGKYDGALKAEHGTGRNMAPFVATEWGDTAYAIMRDLKSLIDPSGMLNPDVILNPDPNAHIDHLKTMSPVAPEVDKCIECGFCEPHCPSRNLTLTPRQRIVVQRELARIRLPAADSPEIASVLKEFTYAGIDTCAVDGLCATAYPVGINTGDLTKQLRAASITPRAERAALWLAEHFSLVESALGFGVRLGHLAESIIDVQGVNRVIEAAEKLSGWTLPKWNAHIPSRGPDVLTLNVPVDKTQYIYFPSCISRQLGRPTHADHSLAETLITIAGRAGINLLIPPDAAGTCCGMPFNSKGYTKAYQATLHGTIARLWEWSGHGKFPVVMDTTSCTHALRTCSDSLSTADGELWKKITLLDSIEFLHDILLPRLQFHPLDEDVVLHPNCSAQRLGLQEKLAAIARQCARTVIVPAHLGCCGFAGDRGLLFPELTRSATQAESAEVNAREHGGWYSSNIPCEIGMSEATGKNYAAIAYLVERASREEVKTTPTGGGCVFR